MSSDKLSIQGTCYVELSAKGFETSLVPVFSLTEASDVWSSFRDSSGIGASDLKRTSGYIYGADRKSQIARISYNGRAWDVSGNLIEESL